MLRQTQANGRCLQTRPAKCHGRWHLHRSNRKQSAICITCSRNPKAGRKAATNEPTAAVAAAALPAWMRGGLASMALAASLALPFPMSAPPAHASHATEGGAVGAEAASVAASALATNDGALAPPDVDVPGANPGGKAAGLQTVYFGNGCFWGRQKDFVDVEMKQLSRTPERLTALAGYAAGTKTGPGGKVCYVYADPRTHYDSLGHAEVIQLGVSTDPRLAEMELRAFAGRYFEQFKKTLGGMQRSDPQDKGPAYRNVIGIPGGINSPFFRVIQEENKYGMELREGRGNVMGLWGPTEGDLLNTVWVVDSSQLPFYRAERYHQFHHGLGKLFPQEYVRNLRGIVAGLGRIDPTGCPELPF